MTHGMPDTGSSPAGIIKTIAAAIRRERERAGLTLTELARRAGLAKSTLSQLESGTGNPSVETIWALGMALGVPFSRLVEPARPRTHLIRAGEGPVTRSQEADYTATLLSSCPPATRRDLYRITAEPGSPRDSRPHQPGTVEHVILSTGRALAGPLDSPVELHPGDYLTYPGDTPHTFAALTPATTAVLAMEHP
ncbi:helix-turn-helix domain-containing protein [Actinocorallia populi]|uniref:helix-turn-helix domain-containing protein n=1 Tax=Actinocorallia populi TaxID=2079200 RepID=UPI0022B7D715|nr:helix-turn-helix domain-containing protein [Actinocorallia populi]